MLVIGIKLIVIMLFYIFGSCLIGAGLKKCLKDIKNTTCIALGAGLNICLMAVVSTLLGVIGIFNLISFFACYFLILGIIAVWVKPLQMMKDTNLYVGKEIKSIDKCLIAIIVIAALLYFLFPTYYMWGGRDYGLYYINGVHTAETGSVLYDTDEYINEHYDELKDIIELQYPALYSSYEDGISEMPGDINAQFLPMYWCLLALGYLLFGLGGLGRITAFITIISLCLFYSFIENIFDRKIAILSTFLLAICPAQIWGARITQSEQLAQLVMFLFFYLFYLGWKNDSNKILLLAIMMAGFGCFCRLDNYIIGLGVGAVAVYMLLFVREKSRVALNMILIWGGWVATSLISGFYFHYHYYKEHWQRNFLKYIVITNAVLIVLVILIFLLRSKIWRLIKQELYKENAEKFRIFVVAVLVLMNGFLYFVRPNLQSEGYYATALREYCWYICPLTFVFALYGISHFWKRCNTKNMLNDFEALEPFLLIGIGMVTLYSIEPSITMDHFWMSRRWVPVCFPFLISFGMYGMEKWVERFGKKANYVLVILCCIIFAYVGYKDKGIYNYQSYQGMYKDYEELVEAIPENAIILTKNEGCASVLKYVYDRNVYLMRENYDTDALYQYVCGYSNIYYMGELNDSTVAWGIKFENLYRGTVGGEAIESYFYKYPEEKVEYSRNVDLYHLSPMESEATANLTYCLSLSENSSMSEYGIEMTTSGMGFFGPYCSVDAGEYIAKLEFQGESAEGVVEIVVDEETIETINVSQEERKVAVPFTIEKDKSILQIRYTKSSDSSLQCKNVLLKKM